MSVHTAFPADGYTARWQTWDGLHHEVLTLRWENEGWTATGEVERERVHYAIRLSPTWHVRQFLLFRDLDEPDLWLATDGHARWGEMNGAHRTELDGCVDLDLACTPFTATIPIRRVAVEIGGCFDTLVAAIDVEHLSVVPRHVRYTRTAQRRWRREDLGGAEDVAGRGSSGSAEFDVDEFGLTLHYADRFRRL